MRLLPSAKRPRDGEGGGRWSVGRRFAEPRPTAPSPTQLYQSERSPPQCRLAHWACALAGGAHVAARASAGDVGLAGEGELGKRGGVDACHTGAGKERADVGGRRRAADGRGRVYEELRGRVDEIEEKGGGAVDGCGAPFRARVPHAAPRNRFPTPRFARRPPPVPFRADLFLQSKRAYTAHALSQAWPA